MICERITGKDYEKLLNNLRIDNKELK